MFPLFHHLGEPGQAVAFETTKPLPADDQNNCCFSWLEKKGSSGTAMSFSRQNCKREPGKYSKMHSVEYLHYAVFHQ